MNREELMKNILMTYYGNLCRIAEKKSRLVKFDRFSNEELETINELVEELIYWIDEATQNSKAFKEREYNFGIGILTDTKITTYFNSFWRLRDADDKVEEIGDLLYKLLFNIGKKEEQLAKIKAIKEWRNDKARADR